MNCTTARELLLQADPRDLSAGAIGPLQEHLAACPSCRAAADLIRDAQFDLRAAMTTLGQQLEISAGTVRSPNVAAPWRRRRTAVAVPLAMAALLAALVLLPRLRPDPTAGRAAPTRPQPGGFEIELPAGPRQAAVLTTDRPDIIVVWFF